MINSHLLRLLQIRSMFAFNKIYFTIAMLVLMTEFWIALCMKDQIVRPYLGDVLVVIFLYAFIKSFLRCSVLYPATFVILFSFTIELLQWIRLVDLLGLQDGKVAAIVIGTFFSWLDLVAYSVGVGIVLIAE